MDVYETERINALAKQLQENGMACSSSEAFEKAAKMIQQTEQSEKKDKIQELEKKYKLLLEQNNNKFADEISIVKDAVNSLIGEMNSLKSKVERQESLKNQPSNEEKQSKEQNEKIEIQEKADDKSNSNPRYGNINPDDVSIEKFFYFGVK